MKISSVKYAFYLETDKQWQGMPSEKDFYRLFYVTEGRFKLSCMMKTLKIGANQAVLLKPGDRVSIARSETEKIKMWELGFASNTPAFDTMTMLFGTDQASIKRILPLLRSTDGEHACGLLSLLLTKMCAEADCDKAKFELAEAAERYIKANLCTPVTAEDTAAALGVTRSTLAKAYLAARSDSIKSYINSQRISYAKQLLEHSILDLSEISAMLGFADANLFTKYFAYHTKLSPSEYRRRVNGVK